MSNSCYKKFDILERPCPDVGQSRHLRADECHNLRTRYGVSCSTRWVVDGNTTIWQPTRGEPNGFDKFGYAR